MLFDVDRASDWHRGILVPSPCRGAIPLLPDEEGKMRWGVEIADLDALVRFIRDNGGIVLMGEGGITIKDDFIE